MLLVVEEYRIDDHWIVKILFDLFYSRKKQTSLCYWTFKTWIILLMINSTRECSYRVILNQSFEVLYVVEIIFEIFTLNSKLKTASNICFDDFSYLEMNHWCQTLRSHESLYLWRKKQELRMLFLAWQQWWRQMLVDKKIPFFFQSREFNHWWKNENSPISDSTIDEGNLSFQFCSNNDCNILTVKAIINQCLLRNRQLKSKYKEEKNRHEQNDNYLTKPMTKSASIRNKKELDEMNDTIER